MKSIMSLLLAIALSFSTIQVLYAFQNTAFDQSVVPDSLVVLKKRAYNLTLEGEVEKAVALYKTIKNVCYHLGYTDMALNIFEYELEAMCYNTSLSPQQLLNQLQEAHFSETRFETEGVYYTYVAEVYFGLNEIDSFYHYYEKSAKLLKDYEQYLQLCNLELLMVSNCYSINDIDRAYEALNKATNIVNSNLVPKSITVSANYYIFKALYHYNKKEFKKSEFFYMKGITALEEDKSIGDYYTLYAYYNTAVLYDEMEDFDNAILYYEKCRNLALENNFDYVQWVLYTTLYIGTSYAGKEQHGQALKLYHEVISAFSSMKEKNELSHRLLVESYQHTSRCHIALDNLDSCQYYLDRLAKFHRSCPHRQHITSLNALDLCLKRQNPVKAKAALNTYKQAVQNYSEDIHTHNQYLYHLKEAAIDLLENNPQHALTCCQKSLCALSPDFSKTEAYANPTYRAIEDKDKIVEVLPMKLKVLETLYQQQDPNVTPDLLLATAKLAIQGIEYKNDQFKTKTSQRYWLRQKAIPLFEKAIAVAFGVYERTGDERYLREAFQLSEQSKSMMLRSVLQDETAETFGGIPDSLIEREQWLTNQCKSIKKQLRDAELAEDAERVRTLKNQQFEYHNQKTALLHHFEHNYPKYYELKHTTKKITLEAVQRVLDERTALIEYFQGEDHIYVFTVTRDGAFARRFERTEDYDRTIAEFQQQLIDVQAAQRRPHQARQRLGNLGYDLYQRLLADNLVEGKTRLMFIPDGQLGYLPFETLLTKPTLGQGNPNFATLPYLLRDYTIHYNYSALLLLEQRSRQQPRRGNKILALAPSYANKEAPASRNPYERALRLKLEELPGAMQELAFLKKHFGGLFLQHAAASEAAFKKSAGDYDILHLAVHGIVDHDKPDLSGLALEEDNSEQEDNFLYAYEIKQLDLKAELVVLSACETGNGQFQRGEGVLSIGRGFMYAGVPSMLTTLWSLNDYSSSIIVEHFYENLQAGMDKDEAIRQAKLHYLDEYTNVAAHPALWACFVQVGDYRSLDIESPFPYHYLLLGLGVLALSALFFVWKTRKR